MYDDTLFVTKSFLFDKHYYREINIINSICITIIKIQMFFDIVNLHWISFIRAELILRYTNGRFLKLN